MHAPVTKAVIVACISLTVANLAFKYYVQHKLASENPGSQVVLLGVTFPYFQVAPKAWYKYPWTLVTAAFTGKSPYLASVHTVYLGLVCYYFERVWGSWSLLKYVLLCSVVPVISALVIDLLIGSTSQVIGGSAPLVVAFLVAFKQANPLNVVVIFQGLRIPVKYTVMPAVIFYTIIGATMDVSMAIMAWTSLFVGWWYLRFVKSIVSDNQTLDGEATILKGDKSDAFAFAKFFYPYPLTFAVAAVSQAVYDFLVQWELLKPYDEEQVDASNQRVSGTQNYDTTRRRALGLEVLRS